MARTKRSDRILLDVHRTGYQSGAVLSSGAFYPTQCSHGCEFSELGPGDLSAAVDLLLDARDSLTAAVDCPAIK
jgi:hypothetical protein